MSWLARSIANSLKFDDDDDDGVNTAQKPEAKQPDSPESRNDDISSPASPTRGVKEDLSEISKTLTRQFWGVASFLAPPPPPQHEQRSDPDVSGTEQGPILGIRGDFAEIGGRFRSGISRLSNNINVSEITKMASNFLQLESDDESEEMIGRESFDSLVKGAVGVTEEVVAFARDIAMHPETWLDFPLPDNVGDDVDFHMSDAQQEHALAVERLAPRLAALRIELCPGYMSESCFWKIYFVLLHPRLDKQDAELLSTPQIVEARALLSHELKNRNAATLEDLAQKKSLNPKENASLPEEPLSVPSPVLSENERDKASPPNVGTSSAPAISEIVGHLVEQNKIQIVDNSVTEEKAVSQFKDHNSRSASTNVSEEKDEEDADDWLKEETSETGAGAGNSIPIENDEDVSFSDLEEDDGDIPTSYRKSNYSSDKDSRDWVQLRESSSDSSKDTDMKHSDKENATDHETKESNDWLDIDDIVVD